MTAVRPAASVVAVLTKVARVPVVKTLRAEVRATSNYLFARRAYAGRDTTDLPQIVLLDLNLPTLGGLEVLRAIRSDERTKLLPVVILTSSKEERDLVGGYESGANSYIVKPVDFTQFA